MTEGWLSLCFLYFDCVWICVVWGDVKCGDGWTLRFFFLLFGVDEVMGEVIDTDVDIDGLGRGGVFYGPR